MLAIGIEKIEIGDVGDGVPGIGSYTQLTPIAKDTLVFNFSDPQETKIEAEDLDDAVDVSVDKDVDSVEFAVISPSAANLVALMGGTASGDDWDAPSAIPNIYQTVKIYTRPKDGEQVIYTIVNAKIVAKFSQAPAKGKEERVLVKAYVTSAITSGDVVNTPFKREVVTV